MSKPIIHQQIEYLLKKVTEQHEQMKQKQGAVPQGGIDAMIQNLRQLYEAALLLYQENAFATLDEMAAVAEQKILAEKRAAELRQSQQPAEPPPIQATPVKETVVEISAQGEVKAEKPKTKKAGNVNASLFENAPTVGGKFGDEERLHTKIASKTSGETISHKHHHKPIADLKAAIGVNEKFLFINKLFDSSSQQYNEAVERLNTAQDYTSAKRIIDEELSNKYNWKADNEVVKEFVELVERRFIS
jgi:hypothetical protein